MTNAPITPDGRLDWLDDGAVLTITRPARLNAVTRPVLDLLEHTLDQATARGARFLVLTGEGERAFCAGTDLQEARDLGDDAMVAKCARARSLLWRLSEAPFISVAAVNGLAFGGGLELAITCTMRIAVPAARFAMPEIKLGVLPAYGGTQFLPALIGRTRALDLMLTGRTVEVAEAQAIGLVDRVATADAPLLEQALALARSITVYSADAIDAIRRCVQASGPDITAAGMAVEDAAVQVVMRSDDAHEGIAAFLDKRAPRFNRR